LLVVGTVSLLKGHAVREVRKIVVRRAFLGAVNLMKIVLLLNPQVGQFAAMAFVHQEISNDYTDYHFSECLVRFLLR
jgi:hypothetical protein